MSFKNITTIKISMIIGIGLLLFVCLQSVSAADYYVDPVSGLDTNPGTLALPKQSILGGYNAASSNDNVILQPGSYSGSNNTGITLSNKQNMTIKGNTAGGDVIIRPTNTFISIDAGTSASDMRTINISNLIITGSGRTTSGTNLITINSFTNVNINNVTFINTTSTVTGRAIVFSGTQGSLNINNSQFINLYISGDGVAFNDNAANTYFPLFINNTVFKDCYGSTNGGTIRHYYGSAPVDIYNSNFTNCSNGNHGGVFCISGTNKNFTSNNCIFIGCRSLRGGVTTTHSGTTYFYNSQFINCSATSTYGGVIEAGGAVVAVNCTFIGNTATSSGGAIHTTAAVVVNITNCSFINNSAGTFGGAIASGSTTGTGTINIVNSNFTNNRAGSASYGGAIAVAGSSIIGVNNASFLNNSAGTYGGAVGAYNGTITLNNANFTSNYVSGATVYGGAIGAYDGTILVNSANFVDNYVSGSTDAYGGALGSNMGKINCSNAEFANNFARNTTTTGSAYGGAAGVNSASAAISLVNCSVHGNWAKYGGAFGTGTSGGTIRVNNSEIFNNSALTFGGVAGVNSASGTILIDNSKFYNNVAGTFGGVSGATAGTINITNIVSMTNNSAGTFGGVAGLDGNGNINILNSFLNNNIAVTFGGAVGATGGIITIRNSSFNKNRVTAGYGGAIGLQSGTINTYDSQFINNTATDYGGAVGVSSVGNFYANNTVFINNSAGTYGGAIGSGAGVHIEYCNFTSNYAVTNGGAVAAMAPTGATTANANLIYSCQFEYNRAGVYGNAIYAANYLTANYNRFFNNTDDSGSLNNTLWTNIGQPGVAYNYYYGVNIDFNWWGENRHWAVGHTPNNYFVVNVTDPVFYNGSAHYTYTIYLVGTNTTGANVSRLPSFFGDIHFTYPPFNSTRNFTAHYTTVISLPFTANATQKGYFQVDNQIISFDVRTNTTPNVGNLTFNLAGTGGKYNDTVVLNATFTDSYGYAIEGLNVTFWVDGVYVGSNLTDANGYVTCPYIIASAGNFTYTAVYTGNNPNYNPMNGSTILEFYKLNTTIVVNGYVTGTGGTPIGLNVTIYDEKGRVVENLIISFYNNATGAFYGNATSNALGQATLNYTFPTSGNYTWDAYFAGNGNYTMSNSSTSVNGTGKAEITVILTNTTVNNASGVATLPVVINGTVLGVNGVPITGLVNITINGTLYPNVSVVDGKYNLTVIWNVSGTYTIFVQYIGDGTYNRSNATGFLNIALMPTNTTVTNASGAASNPTTITGTVYSENGVVLMVL